MDNQTIIVKKIKKGGHGHHGGAWKVAFADFAVAMMAFFLLLWLIASTTKEEKAGMSQYFAPPTSGLAEGSGSSVDLIDMGGGQRISQGDDSKQDAAKPSEKEAQEEAEAEKERLESLMDELKKVIESSQALKPFKDQLLLDITPEGLRIQIVDKENRPMFDIGSAELKAYTKEILHELAKTINTVPNLISLTGHTDAARFTSKKGYTNWELSADRANASRRELVNGGLSEGRIAKVVGLSSIVPFNKEDPRSPINRRIAIIVMNKAAEAALLKSGAQVSSEEDAQQVLDQGIGESPAKSIVGSLETLRPAEKPAATQEAKAPVAEKKAAVKNAETKNTGARTSPAVELAPAESGNTDSVIPIINPIQLPTIPGTD